ncbi:MAG: hypothetical protein A2Y40_04865 [Candidatus Margulisbacteria bacterium GWF2_35_9]|nr:MAG: hypothetical protein A2Y40_04865 [Candidatus Margulisbacteria bacterium GWF2_35_9]
MRLIFISIIIGCIFCFSYSDILQDYSTARKLFRSGNKKESIQLLKKISQEPSEVQDFSLYYLGQLSSVDESIPIYEELLKFYPNFILSSNLQNVITDYSISKDNWNRFGENELWTIASRYFSLSRWRDSQKVYSYLLEHYPTTSRKIEALYHLGVCSLKLSEFTTANMYLEKVILSKDKSYHHLAKYNKAQVILIHNGAPLGIIALKELRDTYQKDQKILEMLLPEMARVYRIMNRYEEAAECYKTLLTLITNRYSADEIRYNLARMYYISGNYQAAGEYFLEITNQVPLSQSFGPASLFMLTLMPGADPVQNQKINERLYNEFPWSYYGHLSAVRTGKTFRRESVPFSSILDIKSINPRVKQFIEMDDYETASTLLRPEFFKKPFNPPLALYLIKLYEHANDYYKALGISDLVWKEYEKNGELKRMPVVFWEKCYPRHYWREVSREARKYGIDPYMMLSLIRQESRFNKEALSRSNAFGLMQLKKTTADGVAKTLGLKQYNLNEPIANIMLGTRYFSDMINKNPKYPHYALACYNAGPNAAKRWIVSGEHLSPEEFAETIDYSETQHYVKTIMKNYWNYKEIYQWAFDIEHF